MIPHPNEHDEFQAWVARVRARNVSIRVTGTVKEAENMRARHRASDRLTLAEFALSCIIAFAAVYLGLGTL